MIVGYAMGGGYGHLRRMQLVLDAVAPGEPAALLTGTRLPVDARLAQRARVIAAPRALASSAALFAGWLRAQFRSLAPRAVVVDAFPLGILGELADHTVLPDAPLYHVARLLDWKRYCAASPGTPRRYCRTWAVEPLTPRHEDFLRRHSAAFGLARLAMPHAAAPGDVLAPWRIPGRPVWLVVHTGPGAEVLRLIEFASACARTRRVNPRYIVISPTCDCALPPQVARLDYMPACEIYGLADGIVTACGFNSMREAAPFAAKHLFLPFARTYDDQRLRAARRSLELRAAGGRDWAGQPAQMYRTFKRLTW